MEKINNIITTSDSESIKELHQIHFCRFDEQKKVNRRLWNISEETGLFLYKFIESFGVKKVLEIGTSNGYSALWMAIALLRNQGTISSIECDRSRFTMASENLSCFRNITLFLGKAEDILPDLEMDFDLYFIDAGKINYIDYLNLIESKLKTGSILIADNVISHTETVKSYLTKIRSNSHFTNITLSIGSGLEISFYKNPGANMTFFSEYSAICRCCQSDKTLA